MTLGKYNEVMDRVQTTDAMRQRMIAGALNGAEPPSRPKGIPFGRYIAIAACAAVLLLSAVTMRNYIRPEGMVTAPEAADVSSASPTATATATQETESAPTAAPEETPPPPAEVTEETTEPSPAAEPENTPEAASVVPPPAPSEPAPAPPAETPQPSSTPQPVPAGPLIPAEPPEPPEEPIEPDAPASTAPSDPAPEDPTVPEAPVSPSEEPEPEEPPDDPQVAVPSIVEVSSAEELSAQVGFPVSDLSIREQADRVTYTDYFGIAEINYTLGVQTVTYRRSEGAGDNSGDSNVYSIVETAQVNGTDVTMKGQDDGFYLAIWNRDGYSHSIHTDIPVSADDMISMAGGAL